MLDKWLNKTISDYENEIDSLFPYKYNKDNKIEAYLESRKK